MPQFLNLLFTRKKLIWTPTTCSSSILDICLAPVFLLSLAVSSSFWAPTSWSVCGMCCVATAKNSQEKSSVGRYWVGNNIIVPSFERNDDLNFWPQSTDCPYQLSQEVSWKWSPLKIFILEMISLARMWPYFPLKPSMQIISIPQK